MIRLGFFQLTNAWVEWLSDEEETFSRVVWVDSDMVISDERYTENIFSGEARKAFQTIVADIIGTHSRSMISGYAQRPPQPKIV